MISCARATRGLRRPSLDTRSGRPSSPPSKEKMEEQWSFDARSKERSRPLPLVVLKSDDWRARPVIGTAV